MTDGRNEAMHHQKPVRSPGQFPVPQVRLCSVEPEARIAEPRRRCLREKAGPRLQAPQACGSLEAGLRLSPPDPLAE